MFSKGPLIPLAHHHHRLTSPLQIRPLKHPHHISVHHLQLPITQPPIPTPPNITPSPAPLPSLTNMPVSWTPATNERLLVAILAVHDIRPNCDALAKSIGPECSAKAVSLQIGKLKKMAADADAGGTDGEAAKGDGAASVPATPKKRRGAKGAKGAKAADGEGEGAAGGDGAAGGTPAGGAAGKAKRKVTATAKAKAATENDGDSAAKGVKKRAAAGSAKGKKVRAEAVEEEGEDSEATVGEDEKKVKKVKTEYGDGDSSEVERSMELDGSVEV